MKIDQIDEREARRMFELLAMQLKSALSAMRAAEERVATSRGWKRDVAVKILRERVRRVEVLARIRTEANRVFQIRQRSQPGRAGRDRATQGGGPSSMDG